VLSKPSGAEASPFDCLEAGCGAIQALQKRSKELLIESSVSWVRGCQDCGKPWLSLAPASRQPEAAAPTQVSHALQAKVLALAETQTDLIFHRVAMAVILAAPKS